MPHLSAVWSDHQTRDAYWRHGSVCEDYSRIGPAVLTIGGWNDNYMNAPAAVVRHAPNVCGGIVPPLLGQQKGL